MSRNGSGTYTLPAGNPVVTGTTISSTWANNTLADMATAITGSVAADGQTPITGALTGTNGTVAFGGVGQTRIPSGTTAQRSASPQDGMIRYNTDLMQYEGYKNGAWSIFGNGAGGTLFSDTVTATQGQTVFNIPTGYVLGGDNLSIYVNGSRQIYNVNYTETSTTSFTFTTGLNVGDLVNYTIGASTSLSVNAASVLYNEGGTGAVNRNVEQKLQEFVSVKDFGAVGDGVTDDTAAIQAAITATGANTLFFPAGTYKISSALTQPTSQLWQGDGGRNATILSKTFNGDLVTMGNRSAIHDITINGNGATYSGKGIVVPVSTFSQSIERVFVNQTAGQCLDFVADAGGGCNVYAFEGTTTSGLTVSAIRLGADTGPVPRFFSGIWLSGGLFEFVSGGTGSGNGGSISDFYINNFLVSGSPTIATGATLFHASNGRVASILATTTLSGANCTFSNVTFSGPVALTQAQGMMFSSCVFGTSIAEDSTCSFNQFNYTATFTPVWSQSSGVQPVIGNGTLIGFFTRSGAACTVEIYMTAGSTTTFGNNATAYAWSLPFYSASAVTQLSSTCQYNHSNTDTVVFTSLGASQNTVNLVSNNSGVRLNYPQTLVSGDFIRMTFTYVTQ